MANVSFRKERCKGCGLCVSVCPRKLVQLKTDELNEKGFNPAGVEEMEKCTGCAMCATMCPDNVIEVYREDRRK